MPIISFLNCLKVRKTWYFSGFCLCLLKSVKMQQHPISLLENEISQVTTDTVWSHLYVESKKVNFGTSLAVQWLRLRASTAGGLGSIPGWGAKILHAVHRGQKKKKERKKKVRKLVHLTFFLDYFFKRWTFTLNLFRSLPSPGFHDNNSSTSSVFGGKNSVNS